MQKTLLIDGADLFKRIKAEIAANQPAETEGLRLVIPGQKTYPKSEFVSKFINSVNAYIKKHKPNEAFVLLDGMAYGRKAINEAYKTNKQLSAEDVEKIEEVALIWEATEEALNLLRKCYPVPTVMSQDWETIDLAFYIQEEQKKQLKDTGECDELVYVTTNQDAHLLSIAAYDPVAEKFFEKLPYDYLRYKALVGDPENGISGGLVKNATWPSIAFESCQTKKRFDAYVTVQDENVQKIIKTNMKLFAPFCGNKKLNKILVQLKGSRLFDEGALFIDINRMNLKLDDDYFDICDFVRPLCKKDGLTTGYLL